MGHVKEEDRRPHNPFQADGITAFWPKTTVPTDIATLEMVTLQHYSIPNCDTPTTCNLFACASYSIGFFQLCLLSSLTAHQTLASKATTNWVHPAMLCSRGCSFQSCPAMEIKTHGHLCLRMSKLWQESKRRMWPDGAGVSNIYTMRWKVQGGVLLLENMQQRSRKRLLLFPPTFSVKSRDGNAQQKEMHLLLYG